MVKFVRSVDLFIDEPTKVLVIGGAAAALEYGATGSTKDIDTWTNVPRAVAKAAVNAREATGLAVPIEKAGVSDGPYHYEDRIRPVAMRLKKLRILEMGYVTKDERILRSQFRALVSRLFGPEAAKRVPSKRKPGAGGMRV